MFLIFMKHFFIKTFEYRIYVSTLSQIMKEEILSEIGDMIRVIQSKTKRVVIVINIIFLFNMN